ncbi:twin-arginine translocase subunit TatC [Arthrobacter roseus]|uniref:twin-arginine translocase subunit TatC n=1 Tax=Arthrobacter roseus TaxID=136274 RepID=UPI001EF91C6E|nr:twin-arginine translocase subunit TatC [Arthrobacter roseus]MBM7848563.1 sec-independent protein translocase protein TatC [Arthrobacter roseus]
MALRKGRTSNPEGRMALKEHLKELRNRLFKCALAVVIGSIAGFFLYNPVMQELAQPIEEINNNTGRDATLNFDGVASAFDFMIQIAVFIGLILASPVWLYQLWAFVTPGLKRKERRIALSFLAVAVPLFLAGIGLAWLVFPTAIETLTGFTPEGFSNFISVTVFVPFFLKLSLAFGIAFLLPVVLFGLNMLGILSGRQILKSWRITVFLVCVFAAMAAPGADAMSMFYLAVPLLALFFVAIGLCVLNDKRRARRMASVVAETEATADKASHIEGL